MPTVADQLAGLVDKPQRKNATKPQGRFKLVKERTAVLLQEDRPVRLLSTMANFPGYSLNNQLLIAVQDTEATRFATERKWAKFGRKLNADAPEPVYIWVPKPNTDLNNTITNPDYLKVLMDVLGYTQNPNIENGVTTFDKRPGPLPVGGQFSRRNDLKTVTAVWENNQPKVTLPGELFRGQPASIECPDLGTLLHLIWNPKELTDDDIAGVAFLAQRRLPIHDQSKFTLASVYDIRHTSSGTMQRPTDTASLRQIVTALGGDTGIDDARLIEALSTGIQNSVQSCLKEVANGATVAPLELAAATAVLCKRYLSRAGERADMVSMDLPLKGTLDENQYRLRLENIHFAVKTVDEWLRTHMQRAAGKEAEGAVLERPLPKSGSEADAAADAPTFNIEF